jgi:hypothetical protein
MSAQLVAKIVASSFGAVVWPFIGVSFYLTISHDHPKYSGVKFDLAALVAIVITGAVSMFFLGIYAGWFRRKSWATWVAISAYVCAVFFVLSLYSFGYVCSKFDACL